MKAYDLVFLFLKKKKNVCFGHGPWGPHFYKSRTEKIVIFRGFSNFFFRTIGFQLKFLELIEFPNIFHWKPAKKEQKKIKVGVLLRQNLGQIRNR